jgi:hypothetical protein
MPYFIFNDSTGKQRADFYTSQITDVEILWQGESLEAFIAETGFSIAQLGGFKLDNKKKLKFDQALKDAFDNPPLPPKTPQQKLVELTALIASLDYETQADLLPYSGQIATALNAGQVEVAKILVNRIETNEDSQLDALKQAVQAILEA